MGSGPAPSGYRVGEGLGRDTGRWASRPVPSAGGKVRTEMKVKVSPCTHALRFIALDIVLELMKSKPFHRWDDQRFLVAENERKPLQCELLDIGLCE